MKRICGFHGCDRPYRESGYCRMHAQRLYRYGDPGYVTPESVRRENNRAAQKARKPADPRTYLKYHGRHEHRVVAERMLGRPLEKGEIVHHKDGNKHNNHPSNLEVMTQREHIAEHRAALLAAQIKSAKGG